MVDIRAEIPGNTQWNFIKISGLIELCKGSINPAFIWRSLKGYRHGNQLKSQIGVFADQSSLCHSG